MNFFPHLVKTVTQNDCSKLKNVIAQLIRIKTANVKTGFYYHLKPSKPL